MKVLKEKIKKITAGAVLLIALGCMLVSMLGTWVLATDFFTAKETVYNVTMAELAAMIDENNAAYGKDIPVDFTRDPNNCIISALLYISRKMPRRKIRPH